MKEYIEERAIAIFCELHYRPQRYRAPDSQTVWNFQVYGT